MYDNYLIANVQNVATICQFIIFKGKKRYLRDIKNPHKMGHKRYLMNGSSLFAVNSFVREAIVVSFKETGFFLLPKRVYMITKCVKMNLSPTSS